MQQPLGSFSQYALPTTLVSARMPLQTMLSATTPLDTLLAIRLPYLWTSQSDSGYDAIPFRTLMLGCFNSVSILSLLCYSAFGQLLALVFLPLYPSAIGYILLVPSSATVQRIHSQLCVCSWLRLGISSTHHGLEVHPTLPQSLFCHQINTSGYHAPLTCET